MLSLRYLLVIILFVLLGHTAKASHALGADLSYEYLSPNIYRVTYSLYRDCSGIPAPAGVLLDIRSATCGLVLNDSLFTSGGCISTSGYSNGMELPLSCGPSTCNGGSIPGVEAYTYCGVITLPAGCSDWIISVTECCRNYAITNLQDPDTYNQYHYALINNSNGIVNNSPVFLNYPTVLMEGQTAVIIDHGTVEPDGDSLVFSMVQPLISESNPVPYANPFSLSNPLNTIGPLNFDTHTGRFSFTPAANQSAVIDMLVQEYRNGQLVGEALRDLQYIFVANTGTLPNQIPQVLPPGIINVNNGVAVDSASIHVFAEQTFSFQFQSADPDFDSLIVNLLSAHLNPQPTITFTGHDTVTATFTWKPDSSMVGDNYVYLVLRDGRCPINGHNIFLVKITVEESIYAGDDQIYCLSSGPVQLNAGGATGYMWSPGAGLSDSTIANPLATPTVTTSYVVTGFVPGSGVRSDTVVVTVFNTGVNADAGNDTIICTGATVTLNASGGNIYTWSPASSFQNSHAANPAVSPLIPTWYTLTALDSNGCAGYDSVFVDVRSMGISGTYKNETCLGNNGEISLIPVGGVPPYTVHWNNAATSLALTGLTPGVYSATVSDAIGCISDTTVIIDRFFLNFPTSGSGYYACLGDTINFGAEPVFHPGYCTTLSNSLYPGAYLYHTAEIGKQQLFNTDPWAYPAIYGGAYEGVRHQILYTAAELHDMGFRAGVIQEISFRMMQRSGNTGYRRFTIKMGCTADTALHTWQQGLVPVFNDNLYYLPSSPAWNTYNITDYAWDGTTNLVVEICFNNDNNGSSPNTSMNNANSYSLTPFTSVLSARANDYDDICSDATPTVPAGQSGESNQRPNIKLKIAILPAQNVYTAHWSPATGIFDTTRFVVTALPDTSTIYNYTVTDTAGCSRTHVLDVKLNELYVEPIPDTLVCGVNSLLLSPGAATYSGSFQHIEYEWSTPHGHFSGPTLPNPYVYFTDTATVILKVYDGFMCTVYDTFDIKLDTSCYAAISGNVYHDLNYNCTYSAPDSGLNRQLVSLDSRYYTFTDANGNYEFLVRPDNFTIYQYPPVYLNQLCLSGGMPVNASQEGVYPGNDFFNFTAPDAYDLAVNIHSTASTAHGQKVGINYRNIGTLAQSPVIDLYYDPNSVYQSGTPVVSNNNTALRKLTWNLPLLAPGQTGMIWADFSLTAGVGTLLKDSVIISPVASDWDRNDNTAVVNDVVVGSYDPNNKSVSPQGIGPSGLITLRDTTLNYLINFQNVGTAPAQNVIIRDTLDADLEMTSITAGTSSHNYELELENGRVLVFTFNNIMLPDSGANELLSHGYVTFDINVNHDLGFGTRYTNSAAIYFDNNLPVITNTVLNTLYEPQDTVVDTTITGMGTIDAGNIQVYPNPAQNVVYIALSGLQTNSIEMTDQLGRVVAVVKPEQDKAMIYTAALPSGIYFIKAYTAKGIISRRVSVVH